jgi:drug/metabolite transporter (DMT)-like permease
VNAGLMKVAAGQFRHGGVVELFGNWPLYAACLLGPVGFLLSQNAFQQGDALAPALAVIRSVDPIVGVVIGVLWLGEQVATSPAISVGEMLAAAVMVGGISLLAHRTTELHGMGSPPRGIRNNPGGRWA